MNYDEYKSTGQEDDCRHLKLGDTLILHTYFGEQDFCFLRSVCSVAGIQINHLYLQVHNTDFFGKAEGAELGAIKKYIEKLREDEFPFPKHLGSIEIGRLKLNNKTYRAFESITTPYRELKDHDALFNHVRLAISGDKGRRQLDELCKSIFKTVASLSVAEYLEQFSDIQPLTPIELIIPAHARSDSFGAFGGPVIKKSLHSKLSEGGYSAIAERFASEANGALSAFDAIDIAARYARVSVATKS